VPQPVVPALEWTADAALPGLPEMLHSGRVMAMLESAQPERTWDASDCRIEYLRYKPETNCVISYRLWYRDRETGVTSDGLLYGKCFTPPDFALAHGKARAQEWVVAGALKPFVAFPGIPAMFYAYPNDAHLSGLAILSQPKKLQRLLYEHPGPYAGPSWRLSDRRLVADTVRYKPEKRAVIALSTRAVHRVTGAREDLRVFVRTYADARGERIHTLMEDLRGHMESGHGPVVPVTYGYVPERRLLILEALPGRPLAEFFQPQVDTQAVFRAAAALAHLHRVRQASVPVRTTPDVIEEVVSTALALTRVLPESRDTMDRLTHSLRNQASSNRKVEPVFVHGDFHHGQVLVQTGRAALLDFDRSYLGDPAADLGNFCAHAHVLQSQGRAEDSRGLAAAMLAGYEQAGGVNVEATRLAFWTAAALVQLSAHPFRTLQPGWRQRTRDLLDLAATLLP